MGRAIDRAGRGDRRDGVVMTAGLVRGLDNSDAARFAFLLATPPILAAGVYEVGDLTGKLATTACAAPRLSPPWRLRSAVVITVLAQPEAVRVLVVFGLAMVIYNA